MPKGQFPSITILLSNSLRQRSRNLVFVLAVAGGKNLRRLASSGHEVDDIQEAFECTILISGSDGDKRDGDAGRDPDGVLNVKVLKGDASTSVRVD